jgi:carbon starvation protein CstA
MPKQLITRIVVTASLVFLVLSLFGENPVKALTVALVAGVLSSVGFIRDLVGRLSKLAGSAVFFVGTSAALIAARVGRRTPFAVGWRNSTKPSVVSNSSFRASDLALYSLLLCYLFLFWCHLM